jgi:ribosomal protein S17
MTGTIKSNKMTKAVVVQVDDIKVHSKYQKRYKSKKSYPAACSDSTKFKVGQSVEITPCRPVSKTIKFKVVEN